MRTKGKEESTMGRAADATQRINIAPIDESAADGTLCLLIVAGPQLGKLYELPRGRRITVGRAADAGISILDESISRHHATLTVGEEGTTLIEDAGSTNGTFVNGKQLKSRRAIWAGDLIQVGRSTVLKMESHSPVERHLHDSLYEAGTRDALTGMANRRSLDDLLDTELSFAQRHESTLSVLMIDIDHFKRLNDTHGHLAGDEVLRGVARTVLGRMRREDTCARFGGEEFCVLMRSTELRLAVGVAEELRQRVESMTVDHNGHRLSCTVSIGVATRSEQTPYETRASLVEAADQALYSAKHSGRNCVRSAGDL